MVAHTAEEQLVVDRTCAKGLCEEALDCHTRRPPHNHSQAVEPAALATAPTSASTMDPSQISSSEPEAAPARPKAAMQRRAAPPRTSWRVAILAACVASASALVAPTPRTSTKAPRARRRIPIHAAVVGDDAARPQVDGKSYGAELANAYKRCGEITKIFSKTFYFGTTFFSQEKKQAVWAIYVWCRRTDDIVDSPLAAMLGPERMEEDLRLWKERLDRIWVQEPTDALDMALADAKKNYPSMDIEPYNDMIDGMLMDTPGHQLFQDRYETWDELYTYCYRVAGTVGLMVLPVLGTSTTHTLEEAIPPGLSLGIAFQITNILRDVGEDALRGRIYLPREDMARFGVTEEQIIKGVLDDNYKELMKFEIQRARDYYVEAEAGIPMLAPEARVGVAMALRVYRGILDKLEENDYDNFRKRAYVSKLEKFLYLPDAWKATSGLPP